MKAACAALLCCLAAVHSVDIRPCNTYPGSNTLEGFCTEVYATGFGNPRMMAVEVFEGKTLLLVVDSRRSQIVLMVDEDGNGAIEDSEKTVLVDATTTDNVNHGVVIVGDFVFATTGKEMYRWKFDRDARTLTEQVVVIEGFMYYPVEAGGSSDTKWGHQTRTMAVNEDTMFISVGSQKNVDLSPFSSAIRKVALSAVTAATIASPIQFKDMTYLASGLRNEVGLRFDENNTLWGVENGPDNNFRADLGGDVHIDNPPEELNRFDVSQENMFYGYPYCFSEFLLPEEARRIYGHEPRRQWAWERELNQGEPEDAFFVYNDTWCNSDANVIKPHYGFQSHMAPLGISFLKGECGLSESAWPCSLRGKAFVGFHGSWNREPAVGYKVAFIDVETKEVTDVLTSQGEEESWKNVNTRNTRPVDVVFDPVDGKMFVTQDGKGNEGESEILVIRAMNSSFVKPPVNETDAPTAVPTAVPTGVPTAVPTAVPRTPPTNIPTASPTATTAPTNAPTGVPTDAPKTTSSPTAVPTDAPKVTPTPSNAPTAAPTVPTTDAPAITTTPTAVPTAPPTDVPVPSILQHIYGVFQGGNCADFLSNTGLGDLLVDLLKAVLGVTIEPTYFCGSVHFTASYNATTTATSSAVLDSVNSALDEAVNADLLAVLGKADSMSVAASDAAATCTLVGAEETVLMDTCVPVTCSAGYTKFVDGGVLVCKEVTVSPSTADDDLSDGAIAGIVVGSVCAVILIAVAAFVLLRRDTAHQSTATKEDCHEPDSL